MDDFVLFFAVPRTRAFLTDGFVLFFAVPRTRVFLTDGFFLTGLATVFSSGLAIAFLNQVPTGFSKNISRLLNLRVPGLK